MRTFSLVAIALSLGGCAILPHRTKTVYLTRNCVSQETYDRLKNGEPPKVHDKLIGQGDADTRPLAGSALELRGWGHAMLETLHVCADAPDATKLADRLLNETK